MKRIKSDELGLLTRVFQAGGKCVLSVGVPAGFSLEPPHDLVDEDEMWEATAASLDKSQILDQAMPKPRGEVLAAATCFASENKTCLATEVAVRVGALRKTLLVFGDRRWTTPLSGVKVFSDPEPFSKIDISWENAFGGPDYTANPLGRGMSAADSEGQKKSILLPNIEHPSDRIRSIKDRPAPAGFGPRGIDWPYQKKIGSFDKKWLAERWPGFPDDFDFNYFNLAPEDQRLPGYFQGDEIIEIRNLHPRKPLLKANLPGLRLRVFILRHGEKGEEFVEMPANLDTVWLFPHRDLGVVIWRGSLTVSDEEASNVSHLLAFTESLDQELLPLADYRDLTVEAPDEEIPPAPVETPETPGPSVSPGEVTAPAHVSVGIDPAGAADVARAKAEALAAEAKLQGYLERLGIQPPPLLDESYPPQAVLPAAKDADPLTLAGKSIADTQAIELRLMKALDKLGGVPPAAPPEPAVVSKSAFSEYIRHLSRVHGSDSEMVQIIRELRQESGMAEVKLKALATLLSQPIPETASVSEPAAEAELPSVPLTRDDLVRAKEQGRSLSGADLAGLDLSGLDLSGLDFSGAILEKTDVSRVDLSGTDLSGACLSGAIFKGAVLDKANLNEANAVGADFMEANLSKADLSAADLTEAVLAGANLTEARLEGAVLTGADLKEAVLRQARAAEAVFDSADLSGAVMKEADIQQADFSRARLSKADFSGARASGSAWAAVRGEGTDFSKADLSGSKSDGPTELTGACFHGADLSGMYWEEADLTRADFSGANLKQASLVGCVLAGADFQTAGAQGTDFRGSDLSGANMRGINLFEGNLSRARLTHTDLRDSNLFAVDFYQSIHHETLLDGALLKRTLLSIGWRS